MGKYTAQVSSITYEGASADAPVASVTVSVYGDLPSPQVTTRTKNTLIKTAAAVVRLYGLSADDCEEVLYRQGANNGDEYHLVVFTPPIRG